MMDDLKQQIIIGLPGQLRTDLEKQHAVSDEPCDECSMQWQPMSKEDVLTSLVQDLIEELWEYAGDARYSKDTIALLHRAEEEVYEWAKLG